MVWLLLFVWAQLMEKKLYINKGMMKMFSSCASCSYNGIRVLQTMSGISNLIWLKAPIPTFTWCALQLINGTVLEQGIQVDEGLSRAGWVFFPGSLWDCLSQQIINVVCRWRLQHAWTARPHVHHGVWAEKPSCFFCNSHGPQEPILKVFLRIGMLLVCYTDVST